MAEAPDTPPDIPCRIRALSFVISSGITVLIRSMADNPSPAADRFRIASISISVGGGNSTALMISRASAAVVRPSRIRCSWISASRPPANSNKRFRGVRNPNHTRNGTAWTKLVVADSHAHACIRRSSASKISDRFSICTIIKASIEASTPCTPPRPLATIPMVRVATSSAQASMGMPMLRISTSRWLARRLVRA